MPDDREGDNVVTELRGPGRQGSRPRLPAGSIAESRAERVGSPPVRRVGRPGHDLEAVLSAAVAAFTEKGFDGTSIDDIARRLGIGKSAIYHHIESKDALLGLALDRALVGLEQAVQQSKDVDGPAVERLEALVRASVEVLVARLPYVTLLLRVRGNSEIERQALARRRRIDRVAAELVRHAIAEGDLRADADPVITARLLFGAVNSLTEWLKIGRPHDPLVLSDAITEMAFGGLRRRR